MSKKTIKSGQASIPQKDDFPELNNSHVNPLNPQQPPQPGQRQQVRLSAPEAAQMWREQIDGSLNNFIKMVIKMDSELIRLSGEIVQLNAKISELEKKKG